MTLARVSGAEQGGRKGQIDHLKMGHLCPPANSGENTGNESEWERLLATILFLKNNLKMDKSYAQAHREGEHPCYQDVMFTVP